MSLIENRASALAGRTAVITGASKRIGREIALSLAAEGAGVVVHYRRSAREAATVCDEIRQYGVDAWAIGADLGSAGDVNAFIGRALEIAGNVDILINNASLFTKSTLSDITFDDLLNTMMVNAWSPLVLCREFKKLVGKGAIVNILDSRIAGHDPSHLGYHLSKRTFYALTLAMAVEFAPDITVNAVAPGGILPPPGKDRAYLEQLAAGIPLKRHGDPQDVSHAVNFLLSSGFITGQVLFVDGGSHLYG
ncbi:MAG: SDR family oxidoreductase [Chitinispirillaceae bacterium]|nr:SDR family oxidoreductase [Chitinispirillaceae bacterium]